MVMIVMTTLVVSSAGQMWTTPGYRGVDLTGKMVTLSRNEGRIHFFPPSFSFSPPLSTSITSVREKPYIKPPATVATTTDLQPMTTAPTSLPRTTTLPPKPKTTTTPPPRPRTTTTTTRRRYTTRPWPTPTPSSTGVSVCLRFLTDSYLSENFPLFTLGPSRSALQVDVGISGIFRLSFDSWGHSTIFLKPNVRLWSNMWPDMWTSICITVDPLKNVVQLFSGSFMSIRKLIPAQYMWSGEPVVYFSGFDGQVTDLQVWDYPLRLKEIYSYMQPYGYQGSVLTWSRIGYSLQGNALLEDTFERQGKQPIRGQGRDQKDRRQCFKRKERRRQQL